MKISLIPSDDLFYPEMEVFIMRKTLALLVVFLIAAALVIPAFADFTIQGTSKAPVIDGEIDECYGLIHDFYSDDKFTD